VLRARNTHSRVYGPWSRVVSTERNTLPYRQKALHPQSAKSDTPANGKQPSTRSRQVWLENANSRPHNEGFFWEGFDAVNGQHYRPDSPKWHPSGESRQRRTYLCVLNAVCQTRLTGVGRFRYRAISVHTLSLHVFSVHPVSVHWKSVSVQSLSVHTKYR